MQSFKRKITYFYEYNNGNIGTTAGFLKLEVRGDKVKIIINIQESAGLPHTGASLYFYHEAGDHLAAIKVDKVESIDGVLTYHDRTDWQQMFDTGRDLYTFDGVAVVYNNSHYYIGDFQDRDRKNYVLVLKEVKKEGPVEIFLPRREEMSVAEKRQELLRSEVGELIKGEKPTIKEKLAENVEVEENQGEKMPEKAEASKEDKTSEKVIEIHAEEQKDVFEECENCPYRKKREEKKEQNDGFEKMLKEYPKLPMYGATELFDCVRIMPKDIGKLDMRNWKLGVNSFLTHGFYTYQYLLLGKMRFGDGTERPIIGVPVFSNREKYLANMFGFEQFIPIKKTGARTGAFGYWIVEINPYL